MKRLFCLMPFFFCVLLLSKPTLDVQIQNILPIKEKGEPFFLKYALQILKTETAVYVLGIENIGAVVYKFDNKGNFIEKIGQREFNRGPKMVSEIQIFEDQLIVSTRAELFFYDENGNRTKTLNLGNKMASSVAMIDNDTAIIADYDSHSVSETWHYKLEFKSRKKIYFGDRPLGIYKALRQPRVPNWGNSTAYLIKDKFWFVQGFGSTIFIYDLNGRLEKRVHAPVFDAIMIEDLEYKEVVKDYRPYMMGTARTLRSVFDGQRFYQYMTQPGLEGTTDMLVLNLFNTDGELIAHNLKAQSIADLDLIVARSAGNGELYNWLSSIELDDDEPLRPALQKLVPYLENPDALRQDGSFIVTFKIALNQPAAP